MQGVPFSGLYQRCSMKKQSLKTKEGWDQDKLPNMPPPLTTTHHWQVICPTPGNTKGGSITVLLTSCLTGLDQSVLQIKTNIVSCHTADSKPVKHQVNGTVKLPPLVFSAFTFCFTKLSVQRTVWLGEDSQHRFKRIYLDTAWGLREQKISWKLIDPT